MESAFTPFGPGHLTALALVAGATGAVIHLARRGGAGTPLRLTLAAVLAGGHLTELLRSAGEGWFTLDMLPLHMCDLAAVLAVVALVTRHRHAVELLYFFALSGTVPALFTPELGYAFPDFRTVVYFVEHGLVVVSAIALVWGFGIVPPPGAWKRAVLALNLYALAIHPFNLAFGTNFLYLSHKPVKPTPFDWFGPWPWYVVTLEILVLVIFRALDRGLDGLRAPSLTPPPSAA